MARALPSPLLLAAPLAASVLVTACRRDPPPAPAAVHVDASAPSAESGGGAFLASGAPASPLILAPARRLRWAEPPEGTADVAAVVREARAREAADGRALIVYVGAAWCEPCQRFHHAAMSGELDDAFPALTVLAFDADRDGEALATAGYVSRFIPLFALPAANGRDSGKRIEGSVKGAEAIGEITPRLRALLTGGASP